MPIGKNVKAILQKIVGGIARRIPRAIFLQNEITKRTFGGFLKKSTIPAGIYYEISEKNPKDSPKFFEIFVELCLEEPLNPGRRK